MKIKVNFTKEEYEIIISNLKATICYINDCLNAEEGVGILYYAKKFCSTETELVYKQIITASLKREN